MFSATHFYPTNYVHKNRRNLEANDLETPLDVAPACILKNEREKCRARKRKI